MLVVVDGCANVTFVWDVQLLFGGNLYLSDLVTKFQYHMSNPCRVSNAFCTDEIRVYLYLNATISGPSEMALLIV